VGLAALAVAGIAAVLVIGACGGDDDDGDGEDGSPTASRTAPRTSTGGTAIAGGSAVPGATSVTAEQVAEAEAVLTAIAAGEQVPEATAAAARTAIAAATQAPPTTPAPGESPGPAPTARPTGENPRLSIDADPTNGSGPCDPIDDRRSVGEGEEFNIAVCLEGTESAVVAGLITALTLDLSFGSQLEGVKRSDTSDVALNGNPDLNEGSHLGGTDWDCNVLDDDVSLPRPVPSPALLVCNTVDVQPNQLAAGTAVLASFALRVRDGGDARLDFADRTSILFDVLEGVCGDRMDCEGATIDAG
jgi:hypothetical protein